MKNLKIYLLIAFFEISILGITQTYTSTGNGAWGTVVFSDVTAGDYRVNNAEIVNIHHIVTTALDIDVRAGGTLNIGNDGDPDIDSLIISAELLSISGSNITIHSDGVIYVVGDLLNIGGGNITVDGFLKVTGNVGNIAASVTVGTTGYIGVGGNFTNIAASGALSNSGQILVGGNFIGTAATGNPVSELVGVGVALPISLNYFEAISNETHINLIWQTATEKNNDYFTLERSSDGANYEIIGTVIGAGTSMTALNYNFTDYNPLNGVSYYRLKQTDYDGAFEVFSPVSVSYLNEGDLKVGPNPATTEFQIYLGGEMGTGKVKLYSLTGALVKSMELDGNNTRVDVSNLPKGNYMLVISADKTQITKKVIVQ